MPLSGPPPVDDLLGMHRNQEYCFGTSYIGTGIFYLRREREKALVWAGSGMGKSELPVFPFPFSPAIILSPRCRRQRWRCK